MNHPREQDLALLAGGDAGPVRRFLLDRHVRNCADCRQSVGRYRQLRDGLAEVELLRVNWSLLAAEMRANIRLGVEAGACVRPEPIARRWDPKPALALVFVLLLAVAGAWLRVAGHFRPAVADAGPVLQSTASGVEIRSGANSLTLLNHQGNATNQTVSARGDISARYIDSAT